MTIKKVGGYYQSLLILLVLYYRLESSPVYVIVLINLIVGIDVGIDIVAQATAIETKQATLT